MADNKGERVVIKERGEYRDPVLGSFVRFGNGFAEYFSLCGDIESGVRVSVDGKLPVKTVRVTLRNRSEKPADIELAYYTELLPDNCVQRMTKVFERGGMLFAVNPFNDDYPGVTACLSCSEKALFVTGKETFFSGEWDKESDPREQPCAAAVYRFAYQKQRGAWSASF